MIESTPTPNSFYDVMVREYQRITEREMVPNLIVLRSIRRTKAVRRKAGRLLRQHKVVKGQIFPLAMHKDFGVMVV